MSNLRYQTLGQLLQDGMLLAAQQFLRPVAGGLPGGLNRQFNALGFIGQAKLVMRRPGPFGDDERCSRIWSMSASYAWLSLARVPKRESAIMHKLLTADGCEPGMSLDDWLRDTFFEQHYKRFYHRPFIWHIWDGRKDGFSCLVNYHKLDHKRLETLIYAYLQNWINAQVAAARDGKPGADLRLAAAQGLQHKLKLILDGESPYDIFVRWKPLREQPIGWTPDLNDGMRVNIRPFVTANVLRKPPNIKWTKDRGKEPECDPEQFPWFWKSGAFTGDRINDVHLTNARKRIARKKANTATGG